MGKLLHIFSISTPPPFSLETKKKVLVLLPNAMSSSSNLTSLLCKNQVEGKVVCSNPPGVCTYQSKRGEKNHKSIISSLSLLFNCQSPIPLNCIHEEQKQTMQSIHFCCYCKKKSVLFVCNARIIVTISNNGQILPLGFDKSLQIHSRLTEGCQTTVFPLVPTMNMTLTDFERIQYVGNTEYELLLWSWTKSLERRESTMGRKETSLISSQLYSTSLYSPLPPNWPQDFLTLGGWL